MICSTEAELQLYLVNNRDFAQPETITAVMAYVGKKHSTGIFTGAALQNQFVTWGKKQPSGCLDGVRTFLFTYRIQMSSLDLEQIEIQLLAFAAQSRSSILSTVGSEQMKREICNVNSLGIDISYDVVLRNTDSGTFLLHRGHRFITR